MVMDMMGGVPPQGGGGPDLAALLGAGGGGAPAPPGPDLASALGGPQGGGEPQGDPLSIVEQMLDLSKRYLDVEPDHEDLLEMQKISTQLQKLLTKDQQDADQAMSGQNNPRALRKAFGG